MVVKFFQHDIRQGLVKYIGRYILAVLIGAIAVVWSIKPASTSGSGMDRTCQYGNMV